MPDYGHEAADKGLKKLEKDLKSLYLNAAVDMQEKARDFMRDFERKDEQMRALVAEGKWTEEQYNTWRRNQMMTEKRMQDMTDQLAKDLANTDKIAAGMINNTLPSAYAENYNFGTYEIETGTTINTSFTLYDKKTVENLMKADPKIIPQARVNIPEDERWNRQKLTSAIAQGILQGESIPKIANRLQNVAAMDRNAAIRNARTYTTAAENKGRVDSIARANDMGIPADQEWLAVLDDRTRMEHRHLDGQVRPVGEPFSADGYRIMYPGDPDAEPEMIYNCRCTLVSKVRGRIYNDERNESKLNGMSYEEWKHAKDRQMEPPKQEETRKEEPAHTISIDYGKSADILGENIAKADSYAERLDDESIGRFNEIFQNAEFTNGPGSHYDPETNGIQIDADNMADVTLFHEATHWFDYNQDYKIEHDWGHYKKEYDDEGNLIKKEWQPNITVDKEHASFTAYIHDKWTMYERDEEETKESEDLKNCVKLLGLTDTYGFDRKPEDIKHDLEATRQFLEERGIQTTDPDYTHISDFISAMTYDANLGSFGYGGHDYNYWVYNREARVSEITAGYNLLKATGREDIIAIEKEVAPNLMGLIEEEWAKIW